MLQDTDLDVIQIFFSFYSALNIIRNRTTRNGFCSVYFKVYAIRIPFGCTRFEKKKCNIM